ncbi:hypothetical protein HanRHA438_Chr15g0687911 [Helianthus annuus]|uniref:Uncharacterized protein n=1 Tax=Helianthus annuus TaxID=4232 RepID=A0A251S5J4_HELAN|nr:hypothetical protein HanXRQr2_Chr15g0675491 [Helianthus annuus]KAJ0471726.1 hypothetical protein HanHA89_Chr15g0599221 [Helianthus annuus]KAJ0647368.1 hypothetical protein HanLR1_Chr15g0561081 [Helianthus annuus]KAJ0651247.1 hypothetical protein HanOQP8_Chr15g0558901 [Helianthus annuus]KAJ0829820.1 hypothetical protein HanPSC8_Chr15g0648131 [Helianthus annuus]
MSLQSCMVEGCIWEINLGMNITSLHCASLRFKFSDIVFCLLETHSSSSLPFLKSLGFLGGIFDCQGTKSREKKACIRKHTHLKSFSVNLGFCC